MTDRKISRFLQAQETSDGAGVRIKRTIGTQALDTLDPFLLLDEFGSEDGADYIAGFPDHPHRGFETVTVMLDGNMRHKDSSGAEGLLRSGSVQWMTAGRGIVHSEMPEQENGLMRGFQLWVNLPSHLKMCEPRYQNIEPEDIPVAEEGGVTVRVIAGESMGVSGPVSGVHVEPVYLDIIIQEGRGFRQPIAAGHNAFVYAVEGGNAVGGDPLPLHCLGVLSDGDGVTIENTGDGPSRLIVVAGKPINEPVARYGPFVMNTREEVQQAFDDYRRGLF